MAGWNSVSGKKVFYGDVVNVVISKGPRPQAIPSDLQRGVVTWTQAQAALADLHLTAVEEPAVLDHGPGRLRHRHEACAGLHRPRSLVGGRGRVPRAAVVNVPPLSGDSAARRRADAELPRPQVASRRAAGRGLRPHGASRGRSPVQVGTTVYLYLY